jgi:putative ABC transport system permease protein
MLRRFFESLFRRNRIERELDEEMQSSMQLMVDRNRARGMAEEEARRAARLEFESVDNVKEQVRDHLAGASLFTIFQDIRYAWRGLWRQPSFTAVALVTLALGIGVNAAIFSMFYAVLLRPLPYQQPERLALVWASFRSAGTARAPVSGAILGEIEHRNQSLAAVAGIWTVSRMFTGDEPELARFARVTPNFFDVLGVRAALGRTFTKDDGGGQSILLADGIFHRRFAANPAAVGTAIRIQGPRYAPRNQLAGVLPADFELHFAPDTNIPADVQGFDLFENGIYKNRENYYIRVVARLKSQVSFADAQRDLDRVAQEIRGAYTEYAADDLRFTVSPMQADAVREVHPALTALFAGSGFVLLICCVNVASLLIARASGRRREIALRFALGASRGRVLRQLIIEGAALSALAGVAGIAAGLAGFRALLAIRPERFAPTASAELSWPVLALTAVILLAAAILFGLAPAIESFRIDLITGLRAGGRGWLTRAQRHSGDALVIAEITLAFVLVACAALTARTLSKIERVDPGFEPRNALAFQLTGFVDGSMTEWESQLRSIPGVVAVGATSHLPLDKDIPNWYSPFRIEGQTKDRQALISDLRCVTPGYFTAMGSRLESGRYFTIDDREKAQPVAIIDGLLAHALWPNQSAIGKKVEAEHLTDRGFVPMWSVVVGVVDHIQNHSLTDAVRGQIYLPFEQSPRSPLTFVLRTAAPPLTLIPAVRAEVRLHAKNAAIAKLRPVTDYIRREVAPASFTAILAAIFGALALLLAATGIYGVLNYQISRRLPEMGIRMALGARSKDVFGLVMRRAGWLAAIGVALGAAGAFLATRWLAALIFGVSRHDLVSYSIALLLLPAAALIGCWRPARKAASTDPAEIVRAE